MFRVVLTLIFLINLTIEQCFAFESRVYEQNDEDFSELHKIWRTCDELVVYWSADKCWDIHPQSERSSEGDLRNYQRREDSHGKPICFTQQGLLDMLKKETNKDVLVIQVSGVKNGHPEVLHKMVGDLEPFISSVGYKRVLVLRILGSKEANYAVQVLKDTQEDSVGTKPAAPPGD